MERHPHPETVARQVALGYFLLQPTTKQVEFGKENFWWRGKGSLGWDLARAQAHHASAEIHGERPAEDPDYRFAVVQSEHYRVHLGSAVEELRRRAALQVPLPFRALVPGRRAGTGGRGGRAAGAGAGPAGPGTGGSLMKTLLVDNHDSYTYNVFHLLAAASGEEPMVVNNDAVSWRVLTRLDFDAIVLSPGPGRPTAGTTSASAATSSATAKSRSSASASATRGSATCSRATVEPRAEGDARPPQPGAARRRGLFAGMPQGFSVVRYHSLAITSPLGPDGSVDRLVRRRRGDGGRAHQAADVGRAVPPRVDLHRARAEARRELLRLAAGAQAAGGAPAGRGTIAPQALEAGAARRRAGRRRAGAADADAGGGGADRARLRTALRPARSRVLARQRRRADLAGASAPSWGPAPARTAASSATTSTAARSRSTAAAVETVEHESIFDYLQREMGRLRDRPRRARASTSSAASSATSATS